MTLCFDRCGCRLFFPTDIGETRGIAGCQEVPMCFSAPLCYVNKVYSLWISLPDHSPPLFPPAPVTEFKSLIPARGSCTEQRSPRASHINTPTAFDLSNFITCHPVRKIYSRRLHKSVDIVHKKS